MTRIIKYTEYINESMDWKWIIKVSNEQEYDEIARHLTQQRYKWNSRDNLFNVCPIPKSQLSVSNFYLYALDDKFLCYGGHPDRNDNYLELLTVKEYIEKYPIKEKPFNINDPYEEEDWD